MALVAVAAGACAPTLDTGCRGDAECAGGRCVAGVCVPANGADRQFPGEVGPAPADASPRADLRADGDAAGRPDATGDARAPDVLATADGTPADVPPLPDMPLGPDLAAAADAGAEVGCQGREEVCNGLDDDCNGEGDDLTTSGCFVPHGAGTCVRGRCVDVGCDPGYFDVDGDASTGCERGCGEAIMGTPLPAEFESRELPSVAVAADGTIAVAAAHVSSAQDTRLGLLVGDAIFERLGNAGLSYHNPALAAHERGYLIVSRLDDDPTAPAAFLTTNARGAPTSEDPLPLDVVPGRPVVAVTRVDATDRFLLAWTETRGGNTVLALRCGDPAHPADSLSGPVQLPSTTALPAVFDVGAGFVVGFMLPASNTLNILQISPACGMGQAASVELGYSPSGLSGAYVRGAPRAVIAGTDTTRLTTVAVDPVTFQWDPAVHRAADLTSTPMVVGTAAGYWIFHAAGDAVAGIGWPVGRDGRLVDRPQVVLEPPAGFEIERPRVASHPRGVAAAWGLAPAEAPGSAGGIRTGLLPCE